MTLERAENIGAFSLFDYLSTPLPVIWLQPEKPFIVNPRAKIFLLNSRMVSITCYLSSEDSINLSLASTSLIISSIRRTLLDKLCSVPITAPLPVSK